MNGAYFKRLEGRPLPQWAAEIGCATWAQFSLKYILSNPRVTVVLTETSNPKHAPVSDVRNIQKQWMRNISRSSRIAFPMMR